MLLLLGQAEEAEEAEEEAEEEVEEEVEEEGFWSFSHFPNVSSF